MSSRGRGGTYIRFGTGTPGQSASYVRYISRRGAIEGRGREEEGGASFCARGLPEEVTQALDFEQARRALIAFVKVREEEERGRSHFHCMMSFERSVPSGVALSMVNEWLEGCFPGARAAAFLHFNTGKLHAHCWIDARHPDGHKLSISPQKNRELGEVWNRIYCRELGLDERDYLAKTEETRAFKRARARGEPGSRPERVRGTREEPERGGTKDERSQTGKTHEGGPRGNHRGALPGDQGLERGGPGPSPRERAASELDRAGEGALRGADELRRALEGLGQPERAPERIDESRGGEDGRR